MIDSAPLSVLLVLLRLVRVDHGKDEVPPGRGEYAVVRSIAVSEGDF